METECLRLRVHVTRPTEVDTTPSRSTISRATAGDLSSFPIRLVSASPANASSFFILRCSTKHVDQPRHSKSHNLLLATLACTVTCHSTVRRSVDRSTIERRTHVVRLGDRWGCTDSENSRSIHPGGPAARRARRCNLFGTVRDAYR